MKREAFAILQEAEGSWWYYGRSRAIRALLRRADIRHKQSTSLDFGAGHGAMFQELVRVSAHVYAFEPDKDARVHAITRGYDAVYENAKDALSMQYDLIGLFDVVEHIEDDAAFLRSLHAALTPNGVLAITVPAFMSLWSTHDVTHAHFRRYTRSSIEKLLRQEGYDILAASYWNMSLFFPAAVVRLLNRSGAGALTPPPIVDALLTFIVSVEAFFLRFISFPFGVSLVIIARKQRENQTPVFTTNKKPLVSVDIVLPFHNEEEIIAKTVETLKEFLTESNFPYPYTITLADSGSTDQGPMIGKGLAERLDKVRVMHFPKGKGSAVRAAWHQSDADILSFMDVDLSSDLHSFRALIDTVAGRSSDLAIGNRLGKNSTIISTKTSRKFASRVYNGMVRLFLSTNVDDHQCGFKAISRAAFFALEQDLTDTRFFFDTELIALARKKDLRIAQIDIVWTDAPASTVHLFKDSFGMFVSVLRLWWRLRI